MSLVAKLWRRGRDLLPVTGFHFDRPIVLLQSDDWGRVGLRDHEGIEQLQSVGISLGERPYDFYTLETAEDLAAMTALFKRHHDAAGRSPCLGMNFIVANLDFEKMDADASGKIAMLPLANGLPGEWNRPGLLAGYRQGMDEGVFRPALHGTTHFCLAAVERNMTGDTERAHLLRSLWRARTPYIYWRMPWIGYEYWDPEKTDADPMLPMDTQREAIGDAVGLFTKMFSALPRSACAPGYRSNEDTHRAWAQHGIRVAQNGPGAFVPPHHDCFEILHLFRNVEFEPAVDETFSASTCLSQAETCFAQGIPAIVSMHSINFHSSVRDFRSVTIGALDEFLGALEQKHPDLLYLRDDDLQELVSKGKYEAAQGTVHVNVTRKRFTKRGVARQQI